MVITAWHPAADGPFCATAEPTGCVRRDCSGATQFEQPLLPADPLACCHHPRSHFKNESDFVPQSGYFSVDLPGVHIISLHSYVRLACFAGVPRLGMPAPDGFTGAHLIARGEHPGPHPARWCAQPACASTLHPQLPWGEQSQQYRWLQNDLAAGEGSWLAALPWC